VARRGKTGMGKANQLGRACCPGFLSISYMDMENPYGISIWIWTVWTYGLCMAIWK
jgi:hypothetical protein